MSPDAEGEINGCTFLWKIKNISHCRMKNHDSMDSPAFMAGALGDTKWMLKIYPDYLNTMRVYLKRTIDCSGPSVIQVNYQLALMSKNGDILTETLQNREFKAGVSSSELRFDREKKFLIDTEKSLPEDTLMVQCKIWKNEQFKNSKRVSARTIFMVNRRSFDWKILNFSRLKNEVLSKFKEDIIEFDLVLNKAPDFRKYLKIDLISFDKSIKYFSFKLFVIDTEGNKEHCGELYLKNSDLKKGLVSMLHFPDGILENKTKYLPNDVLSVDCEYTYSTGTVSHEQCVYRIFSSKATKFVAKKRNDRCIDKEKPRYSTTLAEDLKSVFADAILSDAKLRTSTKTFPAHKLILSARSSVFRRMFSHDMKENNSGCIDVTDLEDDTVHRMLLYIYTDSLEDLHLENACKLYAAADKYEILSLRSECSSFLKESLSPEKACDILFLADLHRDDDLKSAVQDFILKYSKEVFNSQEWKCFMNTSPQLATDIMHRKLCLLLD